MRRVKLIMMGAAGRDFHNFNVFFRGNKQYEVVAFTATQIPDIAGRKYPASLAGNLYPKGIPIYAEEKLTELIKKHKVEQVVFAYSDVRHEYVMHKSSEVNAAGADFILMGPQHTMLQSKVPVVAVCAVRTGCGKSAATRRVCHILKDMGKKVVAIRHPMPYGDLEKQRWQRFADYKDLDLHKCTIEEREEYEPHIDHGIVVYSGVDYGDILRRAEKEADVIVWDGGNNDMPFYQPDLMITVADPHRPGNEMLYYPGEANLRMADVVLINKQGTASKKDIATVLKNTKAVNPKAIIVNAKMPISAKDPKRIKGKKVLVIEDGPTLTHGEMTYGAGIVAAEKYGAKQLVDPRKYAVGTIKATYKKYGHINSLLPAMGYGAKQVKDLETTINKTPADLIISATPIDLTRILKVNKPMIHIGYELNDFGKPDLKAVLKKLRKKTARRAK